MGKPVSTTGSLANTLGDLNPFRYRGYVYDTEKGLYYLRHRYYSSLVNRFLNLDEFGGAKGKHISHNGYCYCENSPICKRDATGRAAGWILGLIIVGIAVGLTGCSTGDYPGAANCYAYALKLSTNPKTGKPFIEKPNPGVFSGNPLTTGDLKKFDVEKEIISRVEADCVVLNLSIEEVNSNAYEYQEGEWLIALAFAPDDDYHWYRKNEDGTWSHKQGIMPVSKVDQSGNIIYDPLDCDRGKYYDFMGYYVITPH